MDSTSTSEPDVRLLGLAGVEYSHGGRTHRTRLSEIPAASRHVRATGDSLLADELDRARAIIIDARWCQS